MARISRFEFHRRHGTAQHGKILPTQSRIMSSLVEASCFYQQGKRIKGLTPREQDASRRLTVSEREKVSRRRPPVRRAAFKSGSTILICINVKDFESDLN